MRSFSLIFLSILLFFSSCSKAPNNGVPAYVSIQNVTLETEPGQGSSLHGINTIWAESEGEDFGVYELPAVFPVLVSGNRQFIVNAGVERSGNTNFREIYQLYQPYIEDLDFVPEDTIELEPIIKYKNTVNFIFIENFENSNAFSSISRTAETDENNLEGKAINATLNENNFSVDAIMNSPVQIQRDGIIYLEFHYKGSNDMGLGIEGFEQGVSIGSNFFAAIEPSNEWRKIHLDITTIINSLDAQEYKFFIRAALLPGLEESTIYIDNFQILKL